MRKMCKSVVASVLAIIMLVTLVPNAAFAATQNPYAQTCGNAEFEVSTSFCATGETTKVFVDIGADSEMSAGLFALKFDTTIFRAKNVDIGIVLKNGHTSKHITEEGYVKVSYADVNPSYDAGRLFEVELEAIGEIPEGESYLDVPIELEVLDLRNYEDYKIEPNITNGKVTLINTPYGDVNKSEDTTASDALMVLYATSLLVELDEEQKVLADVNGDGKVSAADALLILQYSAGYISNYPIFVPAVPADFMVVEKGEHHVDFSWTPASNIQGYNFYMDGNKVNEEVITDNQYRIEDLEQDSKHTFYVCSTNVLMESAPSMTLTVSTNRADRSVVFKDYDGTILSTQVVLAGEDAVEPTVPTRTGYTFVGWDGETTNIVEDTTLTAMYNINSYTVTFDYLYNSNTKTQTICYKQKATNPGLITRSDYTLEGWYRDKNFTKKWDFSSDVVEGDITLYAKWVTWSSWSTSLASGITSDKYTIQSKTQYSYRDKSTTTSSASSLSGWTKYDSKITSWTSWSAWQNTAVTASTTRQVETKTIAATYKTVWHYNRSTNGSYSTYALGYYSKNEYITLDYRLTAKGTVDGRTRYGTYGSYLKDYWWNESSSQQVVTAAYNQYRYRDAVYTYYYYKWSAYTDWSDTKYTATSTREVKTRTVYRYILKQQ